MERLPNGVVRRRAGRRYRKAWTINTHLEGDTACTRVGHRSRDCQRSYSGILFDIQSPVTLLLRKLAPDAGPRDDGRSISQRVFEPETALGYGFARGDD